MNPSQSDDNPVSRMRVLLVAEAVTLAHVARPIALGAALDAGRYDIVFACDPRYQHFISSPGWTYRPIRSISSQQFLRALATGSPVYDVPTLRSYVQDDLALISEVRPDLIVGDFRLSLSVSARLAGIPYLTISNAYWSPHAVRRTYPLPVLPMTRFMPIGMARLLFALSCRPAFAYHTRPMNRVRREYGLDSLGTDLRRVYTDADHTLYADVPELFPTTHLPASHHYLGPVLWSPPVARPAWWDTLPTDRPVIYVTLGSSGMAERLSDALEALSRLPVTVIAATAGAHLPGHQPANVYLADYLPGTEAAARADLVICNGGSPTSQQALAAAVPVLGIASNMDQFMNMEAVASYGAGVLLRADRVSAARINSTVAGMLASAGYRQSAVALSAILARYSALERFTRLVATSIHPC